MNNYYYYSGKSVIVITIILVIWCVIKIIDVNVIELLGALWSRMRAPAHTHTRTRHASLLALINSETRSFSLNRSLLLLLWLLSCVVRNKSLRQFQGFLRSSTATQHLQNMLGVATDANEKSEMCVQAVLITSLKCFDFELFISRLAFVPFTNFFPFSSSRLRLSSFVHGVTTTIIMLTFSFSFFLPVS